MAEKEDLGQWILDALMDNKGRASIIDVCKYVWENYESELRASGDLFYTWQYDIRWQATYLRKAKKMRPANDSPQGIWEIT